MLTQVPANALPTTWAQRLTGVVKTVWNTVQRRPAPPALAVRIAASQPAALSVETIFPPKQPNVVCLVVNGALNYQTFTRLIDLASAHYHQGQRKLLLDLRQTTQLELSGLFALLSIARLYSGQTPLDPEAGWSGLHYAVEQITPLLGERVKLIAPSPAVATVLTNSKFTQFLASHPDLESALAAFAKTTPAPV